MHSGSVVWQKHFVHFQNVSEQARTTVERVHVLKRLCFVCSRTETVIPTKPVRTDQTKRCVPTKFLSLNVPRTDYSTVYIDNESFTSSVDDLLEHRGVKPTVLRVECF